MLAQGYHDLLCDCRVVFEWDPFLTEILKLECLLYSVESADFEPRIKLRLIINVESLADVENQIHLGSISFRS